MLLPMSDVTRILSQIEQGDPQAAEQLLPLVYEELRRLAAVKLALEKPGQTLQATALVHEAYLRLFDKEPRTEEPKNQPGTGDGHPHPGLLPEGEGVTQRWDSRGHFFAAAAEAMRRILVEQARRKLTVRHGGEWHRVSNLRDVAVMDQEAEQTVIIHELLDGLAATHARPAEVAKMRLFLQMTFAEIAEVLGLSADTAESDWAFARAWLKRKWGQNCRADES
jgi:RNA polymerase sigma factor (sigma-70 family)